MNISKQVGKRIVSTIDDENGECLVLEDGTEIYSGDQGVFNISLSAGDQKEEDEARRLGEIERERERAERRVLAYADTPALAELRSKAEGV